jgi:glycosyltransferase involved in cell wall biosynthesis
MTSKKIVAFLSNKLTLRGTEIAIFDYADYNEKILGNKSIIITRDYEKVKHEFDVDIQAYNKFNNRFNVFYYANQEDIDNIVSQNNVSHIFIIKAGDWDGIISNRCKNIIHCVFSTSCPHGQVYTPIGQTINNLQGTNYPVTPHMVTLPECNENLRDSLNIPTDAIVFGRYGGKESFDITFVHNVIKQILEIRDDVYFLFMNTHEFYSHPNVIYLPGNSDMKYKRKFINSCDALIHARSRGETFGLTCGEFAICEKPVITYGLSQENEHLLILKEKAVIYNNEIELTDILLNFSKDKYDVSNNGYMFYTPENVMEIFNKNCLSI